MANHYGAEIRLYELMGIRKFKILVLSFEKRVHSEKNKANYHLNGNSITDLINFNVFLLYNVVCHISSLLLTAMFFLLSFVTKVNIYTLNVILAFVVIFNLYCIMLQRYNQLRLRNSVNRYRRIRNRRVEEQSKEWCNVLKNRNSNELYEELLLIRKIRAHLEGGVECFLSDRDALILERIAACRRHTNYFGAKSHKDETIRNTNSIGQLLPRDAYVLDENHNLLFNLCKKAMCMHGSMQSLELCIVTESGRCESAYKNLFSGNSYDAINFESEVLLTAYECMGNME